MALFAVEKAVRDLVHLHNPSPDVSFLYKDHVRKSKKRKTHNVPATYPSVSERQPIAVSTFKSQVNSNTDVVTDDIDAYRVEDYDEQHEQEGSIKEKVFINRNHVVIKSQSKKKHHRPSPKSKSKSTNKNVEGIEEEESDSVEAIPRGKDDYVKQKKSDNLVKEPVILECGQKGTKEKLYLCDDELLEVVKSFDNINHIQEPQGIEHKNQQDNVRERQFEIVRKFTRSTAKRCNNQDAENKQFQQSSQKRTRSVPDPSIKNSEGKTDRNLVEEADKIEVIPIKPTNHTKIMLSDRNDKAEMMMDDVMTLPTNDDSWSQEEAVHADGPLGTKENASIENGRITRSGKIFNFNYDEDEQNNKVPQSSRRRNRSDHDPSSKSFLEGKKDNKLDKHYHVTKKTPRNVSTPTNKNLEGIRDDEYIVGNKDGNLVEAPESRRDNASVNDDEQEVATDKDGYMCHQCQRNDKGSVFRCQNCNTKQYCFPCMATWYPNMTMKMFAKKCPFCSGFCNCKSCLGVVHPKVMKKTFFKTK